MPLPVIPDIPGFGLADPVNPLVKASVEADNTPPTLLDNPLITALSPSNTALPVNVPVIVQKANAVSSGSVTTLVKAFTNPVTPGNSLIVVAGSGNNTAMTVADAISGTASTDTFISAVATAYSTTVGVGIFYAVNAIGGVTTVTLTCTSSSAAMEIYEVAGLVAQAVGVIGQTSTANSSSATALVTSPISGPANSLAFMAVGIGTAAQNITVTTGTSWTADAGTNGLVSGGTPSGLYQFQSLSQFLGSMRSVLPTATAGSAEPYAAAVAVFRPVAVGIDGTVAVHGYSYTHITLAAPTTTVVKTGPGVLHAIVVNKPIATAVIEFDDAVTNTTPMGIITIGTATAMPPFTAIYDVAFTVGLTIVTSTAACDLTIVWR